MCFTRDKIENACGFLLLSEFNSFIYCCKNCNDEYELGVDLESHILLEHQDQDTASVFINEAKFNPENITGEPSFEIDTTNVKMEVEEIRVNEHLWGEELMDEHNEHNEDDERASKENPIEIDLGNVKVEVEDEDRNFEIIEEHFEDESSDSDDEPLAHFSHKYGLAIESQQMDEANEGASNIETSSPKRQRGRPKGSTKMDAQGGDELNQVKPKPQSGKVKKGKVFVPQTKCKCSKGPCSAKINFARQKEIYTSFHNLNWTERTLFIRSSVKTSPVASKKSILHPLIRTTKSKEITCTYSFIDNVGTAKQVCRDFFVKCLQVDTARVYRAIHSATKNPTARDNRGKNPIKNKTTDQQRKLITDFIAQFPTYESHGRTQTNRKYLGPTLSVSTLYREYKNVMESRKLKGIKIPKEKVFRTVFQSEFNLVCKKGQPVCKTCDKFNSKLRSKIISAAEKGKLENGRDDHLSVVERICSLYCDDIKAAIESNGKTAVLTFGLQKALETPSLSTSAVLYKRQLWTNNLCIFDEIEKKGYMYVWSENIALRGGQEVGSCLLKHLTNHIPKGTTKIILYSDSTRSQNLNIHVTLFLKKFLSENSTVQTIEQKFFVSGHSFNNCDRFFSLIKQHKKTVGDVYTPTDWQKIITESKVSEPKFHVTAMQSKDFLSSNNLEALIVNRKIDEKNRNVSWSDFGKIRHSKNDLFRITAKVSGGWKNINIRKRGVDERTFRNAQLGCLYPNENEIGQKKYDDLMDLLAYIPHEYHSFYINLKRNADAVDFGLASDSEASCHSDDDGHDDIILIES